MKIFSDASSQPMSWVVKGEKHEKTGGRVGGKLNKRKKMTEKVEGASKRGVARNEDVFKVHKIVPF